MESRSATDFYTEIVLPELQERLDRAFPEFGWKRDRLGWVATDEETTHRVLGVRAERVVAHGPAPRGFLVHGGDSMLWTAYLNGGVIPRGADFVRAVREIAERAGVDSSPLDRPEPRDRRADLLHDFFDLCPRELSGERGARARAYLEGRGVPPEAIETCGIGVVPPVAESRRALLELGYSREEVGAAGVLADSRWPGRLCGVWCDERGRGRTLWARTTQDGESQATRYLYLRGASRAGLPPYGLSHVLAGPRELRQDIVLVEGVFDVHQLRARGIDNVAALGGTGVRPSLFERLAALGGDAVTLCLDRDGPGRAATARAVEQAAHANRSPALLVVDPEHLAPAKDPDALVRECGIEAWTALLEKRECAIGWRARDLLALVGPDAPQPQRREALRRAGAWLGTLPPRLGLEQEDAVRAVAERCGYTPEAVNRAFQSRYWSQLLMERDTARRTGRAHRGLAVER
jgi:DNA primase